MTVRYVERPAPIPEELAQALIERTDAEPSYPWTIVHDVTESVEYDRETVHAALRRLTLAGILTIGANAYIRTTDHADDPALIESA